jgi:hypothetical protein
MDDIEEIFEAQIAVIGIAFFLLFATLGTLLASLNPDSYLYVEFNPPIDFFLIMGFLIIDLICLGLFLNRSLDFRRSHNLAKRKGELNFLINKLKLWGVIFMFIQGFLLYFWFKYLLYEFAMYLAIYLFFLLLMVGLFFYNSMQMKRMDING